MVPLSCFSQGPPEVDKAGLFLFYIQNPGGQMPRWVRRSPCNLDDLSSIYDAYREEEEES